MFDYALIFIVFAFAAYGYRSYLAVQKELNKPPCTYHKWKWEDKTHVCELCGKRAGE